MIVIALLRAVREVVDEAARLRRKLLKRYPGAGLE
jgi:hypothetical protein